MASELLKGVLNQAEILGFMNIHAIFRISNEKRIK